ncbi:putative rheb small monomeric gtpase protein [Erysiphe neolycopersici]|uniref:Putative rheb small monomeric gtpase protein n=1 Tax=Erysiphe neolycopersici TaxID=212602 RepID=A0A420HZU5_9PEZI|nr:putative rheb small monomeric gtpase protein [Erysiphe neolycopersici]
MANFSSEVHVRRRITTYGKTRRKIVHGSVFNNLSQEATTKYTSQNAAKNELRDDEISVDITISNSQKSDSSIALSKDIYDFPSDEDTQNSEVISRSRLKASQEGKFSRSLQENDNQRINNATLSKLRGKSVPKGFTKPNLKANTKELSELTDDTSDESKVNKHVSIMQTSKLVRSIPDNHSNLDIYGKKSKDKESTSIGTSELPESDQDKLKRKYAAVSLKTYPCKMSPRSISLSSSMSKITGQKENRIFDLPVNDDEMIPLRSSPRRITKTSDLKLRRKISPIAARVKESGKNVGPSLLNNKDNKKDLLTNIRSSSMNDSICLGRTRSKATSMSPDLQKTEKKREQKQSKISPAKKLEKAKRKSNLTPLSNDPDVMAMEPRISAESHSIWKDLLGSVDDDQDMSEIPKLVRQNSLKSSTLTFDANQLESKEAENLPPKNSRRLRMIDSLVQKKFCYSSFDQYSIDELESGKESCAVSIGSFVSPNRSRSQSIDSELVSSQPVAQESQSSVSSLGVGTKITYSRQRSMLAEEDLVKDLAFDLLTSSQDSTGKRCRRGSVPKLKPLSSFHDDDDEDEEDNSQVVIKSVHELRKSGATKLFIDECTDLFDRISSPGEANSVRRSGLLDLASKMRNQNFVQQYLANSMEQQLFVGLNKEKDVISGFLIISILMVLLMEGPIVHLIPLLCRNGITKLIIEMLDFELGIPSICKDHKINMSKLSQSLIIEYHNLLLQSPILDGQKLNIFSPRTIALICLKKLSRQYRETENSCGLFSEDLITKLFAIMKLTSSEKSLESSSNEVSIDLSLVAQCLQLHYTAAYSILDENKWINKYLPLLTNILEITLSRDFIEAHIEILKITLQVTNQNPLAIEVFVRPSLILSLCKKFVSQYNLLNENHTEVHFSLILDHLSLLLGVLMNFSESNQRVGECLRDFEHSDEDPLRDMITIFQENSENISQAESEEEVLKNVVLGYLSVTLGYLSLHPSIGKRLKDVKTKLLGCIEEFILIHKLADGKLVDEDSQSHIITEPNEEEDQIEAHKELTERLERLVKRLNSKTPRGYVSVN